MLLNKIEVYSDIILSCKQIKTVYDFYDQLLNINVFQIWQIKYYYFFTIYFK